MLALCPIIGPSLAIMTVAGWEIIKLGMIVCTGGAFGTITPWISLGVWALAF